MIIARQMVVHLLITCGKTNSGATFGERPETTLLYKMPWTVL
jgi:hypothetical protein